MAKNKPEFPPLLPEGFHPKTVAELRAMCVDAFPLSKTRKDIMSGLQSVCGELFVNGITGNLWIDGSFVTSKLDPADVDVVLEIDSNVYENLSLERRNWINNYLISSSQAALLKDKRFHGFLFVRCGKSHPDYALSSVLDSYWRKQFGFGRNKDPKGMAVMTL